MLLWCCICRFLTAMWIGLLNVGLNLWGCPVLEHWESLRRERDRNTACSHQLLAATEIKTKTRWLCGKELSVVTWHQLSILSNQAPLSNPRAHIKTRGHCFSPDENKHCFNYTASATITDTSHRQHGANKIPGHARNILQRNLIKLHILKCFTPGVILLTHSEAFIKTNLI